MKPPAAASGKSAAAVRPAKAKRSAIFEVPNPDDWPPGLGFGRKTLNTKTVKRAKRPSEVLLVAFQHNTRKDNEGHRHRGKIDRARTSLNTVLRGSSQPSVCAELAASILDELGIDLTASVRIDAIVRIEFVFQPPPGWDVPQFYEECMTWVGGRYQHVISAIVHRDQKRPHLHVIVLAVADGRLCGAELSSRQNCPEAQKITFMRHVRDTLGLRPDRQARPPAKSTALTQLALSTGKGAKTHAAAAKSDAALERRVRASMVNLMAHEPHSPPAEATDLIAPTSYLRSPLPRFPALRRGCRSGLLSTHSVAPCDPCTAPQCAVAS